jgi:hypothetical protein
MLTLRDGRPDLCQEHTYAAIGESFKNHFTALLLSKLSFIWDITV